MLHDAFHAGITLKGFDGILEVIGGALLWFVKPHSMDRIVRWLFQHEISRDPRDFIAVHALHAAGHLTGEGRVFASIYLVAHGLVKPTLVTALWRDSCGPIRFRSACFPSSTSIRSTASLTHTRFTPLVVLTVFDVVVICLTWRELHRAKNRFAPSEGGMQAVNSADSPSASISAAPTCALERTRKRPGCWKRSCCPRGSADGPGAVSDDMSGGIRRLLGRYSPQYALAGIGVGSPGPLELAGRSIAAAPESSRLGRLRIARHARTNTGNARARGK